MKNNLASTIFFSISALVMAYPLFAYLFNILFRANFPELNIFYPSCFLLLLNSFAFFYLKKKTIGILTFIIAIIYILTFINEYNMEC